MEHMPPAFEGKVLTIGPLGKSQRKFYFWIKYQSSTFTKIFSLFFILFNPYNKDNAEKWKLIKEITFQMFALQTARSLRFPQWFPQGSSLHKHPLRGQLSIAFLPNHMDKPLTTACKLVKSQTQEKTSWIQSSELTYVYFHRSEWQPTKQDAVWSPWNSHP